MTLDLISRAEARISEINQSITALEYERGEIETALKVLSTWLPNSTAPTPLPVGQNQRVAEPVTQEQQPAEAKTVAEASSADDAGGVQDECAIHPATPSQAKASIGNGATVPASEGPDDSMSGEASRSDAGRSAPATSEDGRDSRERPAPNSNTSKPVEPSGSAASSETSDPVTLTDQIAPKPTLKDRIVALHAEHPDWTARQAAEHLGAKVSSVTGYSSMLRLKWGEKAQPELAPEPGYHSPAAAAIDANNEPVDVPAVRRPKLSERFYVRDAVGRYVHQSLDPSPTDTGPLMTAKRVYAWFPNEQQFKNALGRWPELAKLRKEVPEK